MLKLTEKTKTILIIILIIIIPISIYNNLFLTNKVEKLIKNNVIEKSYIVASEYLKKELQAQGEIIDQTKIVAKKATYFYDENSSDKNALQKVEIILKVGENSPELLFELKEYMVTIELDEDENIVIVGYEKLNWNSHIYITRYLNDGIMKSYLKKIIGAVIAIVTSFSLISCGSNKVDEKIANDMNDVLAQLFDSVKNGE